MKPSKLPMFLCLSLTLGLSGISAESEAARVKSQKAKVNKVKQAKQQRRANRNAQGQRSVAKAKLKTTRLKNAKQKVNKRAASDQKVFEALSTRNISSLMTNVNGKAVLDFGKLTPTARKYLREALKDGPQFRYTIDFGSIPGAERVEIAKSSFRGHDANPLTKEAWSRAAGANSVSVELNVITFGSGMSKVTYTNTMAGTIRSSFVNGKEVRQAARWNLKNDTWKAETL